jgi:hypothetical protein
MAATAVHAPLFTEMTIIKRRTRSVLHIRVNTREPN